MWYQMYRGGLQSISAEELEHTYRTNVFSMFYLCKAALEHMQPGSSIINTSSVEAYQPQPILLDYASTKAAIVNFTKGLAIEVAQQGIQVNATSTARPRALAAVRPCHRPIPYNCAGAFGDTTRMRLQRASTCQTRRGDSLRSAATNGEDVSMRTVTPAAYR